MDYKNLNCLTEEQLRSCPPITIPQRLQREELRFVKLLKWEKKAFETGWTKTANYRFDDPKLLSWMAKGGNYGVACGFGKLLIIDIDQVERMKELGVLDKLNALPTYMVRTRSGGLHYYYFCPDFDKKRVMYDLSLTEVKGGKTVALHLGEMQWVGAQCVAPTSRLRKIEDEPEAKVTIQLWKEEEDRDIATVSQSQILEIFEGKVKYDSKVGKEEKAAPEKAKGSSKKKVKGKTTSASWDWLEKIPIEKICLPVPLPGKDHRNTTGEVAGDCPFCGSESHTGNLSVNVKTGQWHCFKSNGGGGRLELLAVVMGLIECGEAGPGCLKGHYKALFEELRKRGYNVPEAVGKNATEKRKSLIYVLRDTVLSLMPIATAVSGEMFRWEHGGYKSLPPMEMKGIMQELAEGMGEKVEPRLIRDTYEALQLKTVQIIEEDPYVLPVANGILYLDHLRRNMPGAKIRFVPYKDGELPPLSALSVAYDPLATCDAFIEHLQQSTEDPSRDIDVLQEYAGFTLFKKQLFAKTLCLVGPGRDGKSVFVNVIINMLGGHQTCGVTPQSMSERFASHAMYGKLLNTVGEMPKAKIMETKGFKEATGNDWVSIEQKFMLPYRVRLWLKHIFLANKVPRADDDSDAYFDRFIFIVFPHQFGVGNGTAAADHYREERLSTPAMLSGVLNWALAGLKRLIKNDEFSHQGDLSERIQAHEQFTEPVDVIDEVVTKLCVKSPAFKMNMKQFMMVLEEVCFMQGKSLPHSGKVTRTLKDLHYKVSWLKGLASEGKRDTYEEWIYGLGFSPGCEEDAYVKLVSAPRSRVKERIREINQENKPVDAGISAST